MTTFDTIEFTTPTYYIQDMDNYKFEVTHITKSNGLEIVNKTLKQNTLGLHKVSINETNNTVKIKVSSKILKDNYYQGISNNTLEQFVYEINQTGIVLDADFTKDCSLKYVDVKNDILVTDSFINYKNSLNNIVAPKFTKTMYDTGIVYHEKIKTHPIRLTCYSKEHELMQNKQFYNSFPSCIYQFENVLRFETRFPKIATINKYFESNQLLSVLSATNINYNIFDKILNKQTDFKPIVNILKMTNSEEKNFAQIYLLSEIYNGDFESIVKHLDSRYSRNTKHNLRGFVKECLFLINNAKDNLITNNINEIKQGLKEI